MMASTADNEDPFLQVQADVLNNLQSTRSLFTSYLRIRSLTTSPTSDELLSARSDLEATLSDLATDLQDLIAAVDAVTPDPYKYGLEIEEVARRRRLVEEVGGEVEDMREELAKAVLESLQDAAIGASAAAQKRKSSRGMGAMDDLPPPSAFAEEGEGRGDDYEAFEQQEQVRIMAEQDVQLDATFLTVGNLRQQADEMGRELEEQAGMLEEVDTLADRVGGRLQTGLKKVGEVVRRNEDRYSTCCVGVLIAVLVLLLVLVLIV